jgi:cobalamin biosynthesis Mg chelatase CobN
MALIAAVFAVSVSTASAQSSDVAPPGNSAVDQYRESLPPTSDKRRSLSDRDRRALRREGADGRALADVLERSGGVPQAANGSTSSSAESGRPGASTESDRSATSTDGRSADRGSSGADRPSSSSSAANASEDAVGPRSVAPAAASSTVGPVPIWALLVGAAVLVGVGLVVRLRPTP